MSFVALWLAVGALGGAASVVRFLLHALISAHARDLPLGTLVVNLSGTLALGLLVGIGLHGHAYLLGGTAVLGSYTTFSAWVLESQRLGEAGRRGLLVANLLLGLALGVGAAELGRLIGGG